LAGYGWQDGSMACFRYSVAGLAVLGFTVTRYQSLTGFVNGPSAAWLCATADFRPAENRKCVC